MTALDAKVDEHVADVGVRQVEDLAEQDGRREAAAVEVGDERIELGFAIFRGHDGMSSAMALRYSSRPSNA